MSVLVERVMDPEFQKQPNRCFSGISQIGTKRKSNEIDSEFLTPVKMTRKEVSVQDVRNRDVICTFDIDSNGLNNLECSLEDGRLLIFARRSDGRLERRCIAVPDFVDPQSVCMCFDPDFSNRRLLIGFNYHPEHRIPKHLR